MRAVFLLFLMLAPGIALAADKPVPFSVPGEGTATCSEFLSEPAIEGARVQWVLGFIAGQNSLSKNGNRIAGAKFQAPGFNTPEFTRGWLHDYCANNPRQSIIDAAAVLRAVMVTR